MTKALVTKLRHLHFGPCELIRIEAADWIVRVESSGVLYRVPPAGRKLFDVLPAAIPKAPSLPEPPIVPSVSCNARNARRVIESLRTGLPSLDGSTRQLAIGFNGILKLLKGFLRDVDVDGGGAMILKGQYGQGKTFALTFLEEVALEDGYITLRTEVDATENRLNKPHHIYRDLMRHIRLPDSEESGVKPLAYKIVKLLDNIGCSGYSLRYDWLEKRLGCSPLSWLLSDPVLHNKPGLLGLLECDPSFPASKARLLHANIPLPRQWPAFNAGTQGDFASFVISGLGRMSRLLGYKGAIIIMDEMEKWQELNWVEQTRAGNFLGGLIWGASAEVGRRGRYDHPRILKHSGRCGGFPFTTEQPSHIGIAIALTPRSHESDPEHTWCQYGPIMIGQIPAFSDHQLIEYGLRVVPYFAQAYGLAAPSNDELDEIAVEATQKWKLHGEMTTRSGVQSVIAAFDEWRDRQFKP